MEPYSSWMPDQVKGRRKAQSAATRAEVLAAASRLFLAHGYAATTIGAVADEAAAAIAWSLTAPETYRHLVQEKGWSQARYRRWLTDAWGAALSTRTTATGTST